MKIVGPQVMFAALLREGGWRGCRALFESLTPRLLLCCTVPSLLYSANNSLDLFLNSLMDPVRRGISDRLAL